jgi:autotransporter-associated beta strand protein
MHVVAVLAAVGCAVGGQHARADVIAVQDWSGAVEYVFHRQDGVTLGYDFTVGAAPIILTKLGFFDYGADGLSESHEVGIWQLDNTTALAKATITTTSPLEGQMIDTDKGQFRFEELASTMRLSANTTYRIGANYSSTHNDRSVQALSGQTPSKTIADGISYGPPRYRYDASGLVRPDDLGPRTLGYIGPNFQFVPEHNYYRMETDGGTVVVPGQGASVVDDTSFYHGTARPAGSPPTYSSDVPGTLIVRDGVGAPNLASLSFSGTGDYVELGDQPFLKSLPQDDFTLEFFLKTPARDSRSVLVGTYNGVSSGTLNLEIGGAANGINQGRLRAYLHGTNQLADFWSTTNISDDEWHHVALVRSGTGTGSDLIQLYVDYQLDSSLTRNVGAYTIAADFFRLGRDGRTEHYYEGLLDEFRISRAALDVSEFLRAGRTWTGGGADNLWTTAANWAGATAPVAGNALFFGGTTRLATENNFTADTSFAGITFNSGAGAFVLSGNRITLDGNLTNNSASVQTVQLDMILDSTRTVSGSVTLQGVLSGNGGLTKSGSGELLLSGSSPNTYNGVTTVSGGTLRLGKTAGTIAVPGDLVISGGGLTFNTDNQIADGAAVVVSGGATFNGTGFNSGARAQNETIGSLEVTGGSFNTGSGATGWNVTGAASFTGGEGVNNTRFIAHSRSTTKFGSLSLTNMTGTAGDTPGTANTFTVYGANAPKQSSIFVGSGGLTLDNSVLNLRRGSAEDSPGSRLILDGNVTTTGTSPSAISEDTAGGTFGNIAVELSSVGGAVTREFNVGGGGADLTIGVPVTNGAATTAGITKIGAGTLTLSAVNTYNGLTTVLGGTLEVTGSLANNTSADVLVASAGTTFDGGEPAIVRSVAGGAPFADLGSQIIGDRLFDTRADLLAGTNQGVDPLPVGMAWRMFADGEPQSTAPYLHAVSDVVQLTGITETSPFVLQMTFDASLVTPATEGGLHLAWLDGAQWVNAVTGNSVTGDDAVARYFGSWDAFTNDYGDDLNALLGSWGVDTGGASVWAVLNHNSQFGVLVPEPGTWLMLLAAAAAGLLLRRREKR